MLWNLNPQDLGILENLEDEKKLCFSLKHSKDVFTSLEALEFIQVLGKKYAAMGKNVSVVIVA